ncbi:hypothetical protein B0H14DRAFT_3491597 [Mycena olivaceomarginata]|nr:hypothetical protein B0H14DRAFT_3525212 [Mycena olivaceomarginata]KAJ7799449.1 hypothetical protein B0H14DRAFT_3491597 [Mycena olivaceomarginata]
MHTTLEDVFEDLKVDGNAYFHPRKGFEHKRGSETWSFYVVTRGHTCGIYTHWEDASDQVNQFKGSAHKKYIGWSAATSAFDEARRPSASINMRPIAAAPVPPPSTPPRAPVPHVKGEKPVTLTPAPTRKRAYAPPNSSSAPTTPTGSSKMLYVYSRGQDTTIFADQRQASTAARRGLADGSFRKVEVTTRVRDAFERAEEAALECYNISDISDGE